MHCERAPGFGIVARAARPVTGQGSGRPEQRKQKKQLAPRDTRAPSPERTQAWDNRGRSHSRRPHDRSCNGAGLLHGGLLCLHSKKRKIFEQPTESSGPAFWISGPADGIESESAFYNDVGWSTASSPAIRAWLKRLALATEPSTPWKSGASAPRWQRSVLGFQPCTGPEGHLSCAPECGPKRAALPHRLCCSSWPLSSRLLERARFDEQASVDRTLPSTSLICVGTAAPR